MGRLIKLNAEAADSPSVGGLITIRGMIMTLSFAQVLADAGGIHANEIQVRTAEGGHHLVAMVRGDAVVMGELDADQVAAFLDQAFGLCDGADDYRAGAGRMMRLTGERLDLPTGIAQVLMQFLPPGGVRQLVARLSYDGDVCCGSCGGA